MKYKNQREKAGVSGAAFARSVSVKPAMIYSIEAGRKKPTQAIHEAYLALKPAENKASEVVILGKVLRLLRITNGLSMIEAAEKMGVSVHSVRRWEKGIVIPGIVSVGKYEQIGGNVEVLLHYRAVESITERDRIRRLIQEGHNTVDDICAALSMPSPVAYVTLKSMVELGLIRRTRVGSKGVYHVE